MSGTAIVADVKADEAFLRKELEVFENTVRVVRNTLSLIAKDGQFRGELCIVVAEGLRWLDAMKNDLDERIAGIKKQLPAPVEPVSVELSLPEAK